MDLKFYLNKFLKVDNIEQYTMKYLNQLKKCYDEFLEKSQGQDPDFPMINFGDSSNTLKGSRNIIQVGRDEDSFRDDLGILN